MTTLLAQIAPQRSTQYTELATTLAPHELTLSPAGKALTELKPVTLGGQPYLQATLQQALTPALAWELGALATTSAYFEYHEQVGGVPGPWLRPVETGFRPALPPELALTRRYRGKTNELFTHFLCNLARFSSGVANLPWRQLRLLDPLAGGGTTLFTALVLGAGAVAGIERDPQDVKSTAAFIRQFMREKGIACRVKEERLRKVGQRWTFTIGKEEPQRCVLALGDTGQANTLVAGFKPHLMVTDLPYGIQHSGVLVDLLTLALPVWSSLLPPSGVLVFAWDATRFPREKMATLVESVSPLRVLHSPPYDRLAHRVDRVIKVRDVLVARPG
ncbi:MAG: hypothetical protein KatS3mg050_1057 [Litorilinea sp.]|nr:MAG: hypothetical protein KatS3mg050_1057 [Litorilinea sp.]